METLAAWMRFEVPTNASDLQVDYIQGIDNRALLRFDLPLSQLPEFLGQLGFDKPLREKYPPFPKTLATAPAWWTPYTTPAFAGGELMANGLNHEIVVTPLTVEQCRVYLRVYEL